MMIKTVRPTAELGSNIKIKAATIGDGRKKKKKDETIKRKT